MPYRIMVQAFTDGSWKDVDQVPLTERGAARPFSTGKVGYNGNDKLMLPSLAADAGGELRQHQFTANIIEIVGKDGADPNLKPGAGRSTEQPIGGTKK